MRYKINLRLIEKWRTAWFRYSRLSDHTRNDEAVFRAAASKAFVLRYSTPRVPMKTLFLTAVLLVLGSHCRAAGSNIDEQQVLTAAHQANLFHNDVGPFQLEVDFVIQTTVPTQGHLTLKWDGPDRWWRQIVVGGFRQIEIMNGERRYTSRNAPFTPLRVMEVVHLLQFADFSQLQVKKEKHRAQGGIEMTCAEVKIGTGKSGSSREICLNSSHEIVSDEWKEPPDEQLRERYADYFEFQSLHYPRQIERFVDGSRTVSVHVESLTMAAFDPALLVPPAGVIERRQCANMKFPVPVKTPEPFYPKSASQNRLMGDTAVALTVLADGSVGDIQLIGRSAQSMDEATLKTLKGWKFKPAMCGAEPVVTDINVMVSFRLE